MQFCTGCIIVVFYLWNAVMIRQLAAPVNTSLPTPTIVFSILCEGEVRS